eukprot:GGOE01044408.1.p1 GENE.GGOE01044408.1~~GGOE01044408.1.p1  ORF type:complete len:258 (-),score=13.46 GGOE01044408.1:155-928(-)
MGCSPPAIQLGDCPLCPRSVTLENVTLYRPAQPHQSRSFRRMFVHHRAICTITLPQGSLGDKLNGFARKLLASKLAETRKNRRPLLDTTEESAQRRLEAFQRLRPQTEPCKQRFKALLSGPGSRIMPEAHASNVLYVGGLDRLPAGVNVQEIQQLAEPFGQVLQVHLVATTACAFIHMDTVASATCARNFYPSGFAELQGKRVPIRFAWPKKPAPSGVRQGLVNLELLASECFEVANAAAGVSVPDCSLGSPPAFIH